MTFNSFIFIDNNGVEHLIKCNFHRQKAGYYKRLRKIYVDNLLGKRVHMPKHSIRVYNNSKRLRLSNRDFTQKLSKGLSTRKEIINAEKALRYTKELKKRDHNKDRNKVEYPEGTALTFSKTTLRNLRKALGSLNSGGKNGKSEFGFSLKVDFSTGGRNTTVKFKFYNKDCSWDNLKHLCFYNTNTKEKINLADYININYMTGDKKKHWYEDYSRIYTHDAIVDYTHGSCGGLYYIEIISEENSESSEKTSRENSGESEKVTLEFVNNIWR